MDKKTTTARITAVITQDESIALTKFLGDVNVTLAGRLFISKSTLTAIAINHLMESLSPEDVAAIVVVREGLGSGS